MDDPINENIVTQADVDAARALRGLYTDRCFVQVGTGHLRVNFGEIVGGAAVYHTAVVVPTLDAWSFGQLLMEMAEKQFAIESPVAKDGE